MTTPHRLLVLLLLLPLLVVTAADTPAFSSPYMVEHVFDSRGIPLPVPVAPFSNFHLPPPVPSKSEPTIRTICFATRAPEQCRKIAVVYTDRSPVPITTPKAVLDILFQATTDSILGVSAKAGRLTTNKYVTPNDIANLKQCQSVFTSALYSIAAAKAAVATGKSADALANLAGATKDIKGCDDVFAQKADAMSPLTDNTAVLVSMITNVNGMVTKVLGKA